MSKKLYSTEKWKRYIKTRQEAELRSSQRRRNRRVSIRKFVHPDRRKFFTEVAPTTFSLLENPEETIAFLNGLRSHANKYRLTLDLANVNKLTTDGIAVLIATLRQLRTYIRGNLPKDSAAQNMLVGSGFFAHVNKMQELPSVSHGQISQERSKKVQPDLAKELIHFGTRALGSEQKCTAAYSVLIESMSNTHNHAAPKRTTDREQWWATVFADANRKRVCFTFVDTGIGIFKSVKLSNVRKLYKLVGIRNDTDILRDMLHGMVESSTGHAYRGKGLPNIYKMSQMGRIKSLVIVANDVHCNVTTNEYRMLENSFRGTVLYWEIELEKEV
jgi:hypothetical protein